LTFVSATQNILLLLLLCFPAAIASALQPHNQLSTSNVLLAILALVILALEFTADNQQYTFQLFKHAYLAREKGNSSVEPYDEKKHWLGVRLAFMQNAVSSPVVFGPGLDILTVPVKCLSLLIRNKFEEAVCSS